MTVPAAGDAGVSELWGGPAGAPQVIYRAPCFAAGTLIATPRGETPVDELQVRDLVTLATGVEAEIGWIGHRRVRGGADLPIRISRGALAIGMPRRDLIVSPDHALFLDGALVPAGLLANGRTIRRDYSASRMTYYHVELDGHGVLLAEGVPAEGYLDTGSRQHFSNCRSDRAPIDAARFDPCAEIVLGGPRLQAIREALRYAARV